MNFVVMVAETAVITLYKNEMYQTIEKSFLSPKGQRRLHAAAAGTSTKKIHP